MRFFGQATDAIGPCRRVVVACIGVWLLAGCGAAMPPGPIGAPAPDQGAIASSAHRALGAPGPTADQRSTQGITAIPAPITAIPAPITAIPAPITAIPAPITAIPAIGGAAASATNALCSLAAAAPGPGAPAAPGGPGAPAGPGALAGPGGPAATGCHSIVRTDVPLQPSSTPAELVYGMLPGWINQLYNLPPLSATAGAGRTIALVVAYDDPAAEADLAVYRNTFGLPPCTSANGCFTKIAQDGSKNYPAFNAGWAVEAAADVDTVSAVCPGCNMMLVEAASNNIPDLATAVDFAAAHGATVISNSWGVPEASDNVAYDSHFNHPGVAIVASAGDLGYGVMFPASSEYVIAVGGTSLYSSAGGISEIAWSKTNSGCSAFISKPNWQHDRGCTKRVMNDVAVDADPATGMAVYDSVFNGSGGGWIVVGGTSIGAPIVSSIIAMGPHPEHYDNAQQLYNHQNSLFNITSGSNGTCSIAYLCTAGPGYSGPVGVGSPNGTQAFNS